MPTSPSSTSSSLPMRKYLVDNLVSYILSCGFEAIGIFNYMNELDVLLNLGSSATSLYQLLIYRLVLWSQFHEIKLSILSKEVRYQVSEVTYDIYRH